YRRLEQRLFPTSVEPPVSAYRAAIAYKVSLFARAVDRPARNPHLVRRGFQVVEVPGQTGFILDRAAAVGVIERSLADFDRTPVSLPVHAQAPSLSLGSLGPTQALAQQALAAPVTVSYGQTHWTLTRRQLAPMLSFQQNGRPGLALGGSAAAAYLDGLAKA